MKLIFFLLMLYKLNKFFNCRSKFLLLPIDLNNSLEQSFSFVLKISKINTQKNKNEEKNPEIFFKKEIILQLLESNDEGMDKYFIDNKDYLVLKKKRYCEDNNYYFYLKNYVEYYYK